MQTPRLVLNVVITLGVLRIPPLKTLARAEAASSAPLPLRPSEGSQLLPRLWPSTARSAAALGPTLVPTLGPSLRSDRIERSPASARWERLGVPTAPLVANSAWRKSDVAAAEGDPPAPASSSAPEETTTTEEPYEEGESEGGDIGADILNALLEVIGALLSFFTDPSGAISKMVDQAKQLTGGARALMATVREQRQAGLPIPDGLPGGVEQLKKLVDGAIEVAQLGPAGARQARLMLEEAQRILEAARGIVEATGRVANTARNVAATISRPWQG